MPEQVRKYTDPIKARWELLTQPQRYKLLGVIAAVLIAIILMAYFAFRTPWEIIVSGQNMQVITPMRAALTDAGIRNKSTNFSSGLKVDARRAEEAVSLIYLEGAAPNSESFTWADALDTGLGTTDAERRLLEVRGKEGQIERQLHAMNGIIGADVALSIPNPRPFERNPDVPRAAVQLTTTESFSPNQGRNLALLVAHNISNLNLEDVFITDQHMNTIYSGETEALDPASQASQAQQQVRNSGIMSTTQLLSHIFDEVNVVFNPVFDETIGVVETREEYEIPTGMDGTGIVSNEQLSRSEMEGTQMGIEPGLQPQSATFPNYSNPGNGIMSASQRESATNYLVNNVTRVTTSGPSGMDKESSTGAVVALRNRNLNQEDWVHQGIALGEERTADDWRRYKNEITNPRLLNGEITDDDYDEFRGLVAFAMGIDASNIHLTIMERIIPIDTEIRVWDIPTILMVAVLLLLLAMLLYGLLRKQRGSGEDEESLEPQLAVEDLLVSTQLEEAKEEAAQELEEIDYFKENEIKKHIDKFINEKPEAVAALLRNWINVEEW
jgi:flagellar M-ring protein FliF